MISTQGGIHIKRYLGNMQANIATCIAFGIGDQAEDPAQTALQFETGRVEVLLTSYDFIDDKIIFKGELPTLFEGQVHEVALYSQLENPLAGQYGSRLLTTFESEREFWTNATYTTNASRLGADSLIHAPAVSTAVTSSLSDMFIDLSGNSGSDKFGFAVNVETANVAGIEVNFLTDSANYYTFALGALGAGYQIIDIPKANASATGAPDWSSITEIRVTTTANASGAAAVSFDGIRIEDTDAINPEYLMVSRQVLATPYLKQDGTVQEIEVALDVNIS